MKKFLLLIFAVLTVLTIKAEDFADETLTYKVMFKWGLINKKAGTVDITLKNHGGAYDCCLTAASAPWADKFFRVRDTLECNIIKDGFAATFYEKRSHEGGEVKHDRVDYRRNGYRVMADCIRKVWKDDKLIKDETRTLEATGTTVDMLTAFYYMRNLPYADWQKGHVITINIFSGKRKELLTIKYLGTEKVKTDIGEYDTYHISFIFTSDGKTRTSDDMDAWISTNPDRVPVKLQGKLPVGKVQCFLTGKK